MLAFITPGDPEWVIPAAVLAIAGVVLVALAYARLRTGRTGVVSGLLKAIGLLLLVACLVEPVWNTTRARPGANQFVILVDNSRSLGVTDSGADQSRGQAIRAVVGETSRDEDAWNVRLEQDFDVRRYLISSRLTRVADFENLAFDGTASSLATALESIGTRYKDRQLAGILLVSDGNATDLRDGGFDIADLPPVYPVIVGSPAGLRDLKLDSIAVRETPFEDAPITVTAAARSLTKNHGPVTAELFDESGDPVRELTQSPTGENGDSFGFRFQVKPTSPGVLFYRIDATGDERADQDEATFENNSQIVCVNRDHRTRRVLYISGRPNWEFKFLRRALEGDDQLELVGLIRVAKREARFDFRGRDGETSNSLFRGFKEKSDAETEEYDQPVLIRLNTRDDVELRDGFPKAAEDLFGFDAVVVDDIEAGFFTTDQHDLLDRYVAKRGGALLMLGGQESFRNGGYARTAIGRMLPLYLDYGDEPPTGHRLKFDLTKEGWLQPWMRLRETEESERQRLAALPKFRTVNRSETIKPGAMVLASVTSDRQRFPALVTQNYGRGKTAAVTVGDLWRWRLQEDRPVDRTGRTDESDQSRAWRQLMRWLVVDVPQRTNIEIEPAPETAPEARRLRIRVRNGEFEPVENATVEAAVTTPAGAIVKLAAEAGDEAGLYETTYVPRAAGMFRVNVAVTGPDGSDLGTLEAGWATDPARREFASVAPNVALMERLAKETGGEIVALDELDPFVTSLSTRDVKIKEQFAWPLWHQSWVFLLAIGCLIGEWGLRRIRGLP